jgi:hypothetical protein
VLDNTPVEKIAEMAESVGSGVLYPRRERINSAIEAAQVINPQQTGDKLWHAISMQNPASRAINATGRNEVLQNLGYDAVRHAGGLVGPVSRRGDLVHNIAIALKPENVFAAWDVPPKAPVPSLSPRKSRVAAWGAGNMADRFGGYLSQTLDQ